MFICKSCEKKITPIEEYCSSCQERNVNYCSCEKNLIAVFFLLGLALSISLALIFQEIGFLQGVVLTVFFCLFGYFFKGSPEYVESIAVKLIRKHGNELLSKKERVSYSDLFSSCGWRPDNQEEHESFKQWIAEVAKAEGWNVDNGEIQRCRGGLRTGEGAETLK